MVNIQWSTYNGHHTMVSIQWSAYNGQQTMVSTQWSAYSGQHTVVSIQWTANNGQHTMVNIQWPTHNVQHTMTIYRYEQHTSVIKVSSYTEHNCSIKASTIIKFFFVISKAFNFLHSFTKSPRNPDNINIIPTISQTPSAKVI